MSHARVFDVTEGPPVWLPDVGIAKVECWYDLSLGYVTLVADMPSLWLAQFPEQKEDRRIDLDVLWEPCGYPGDYQEDSVIFALRNGFSNHRLISPVVSISPDELEVIRLEVQAQFDIEHVWLERMCR